MWSLQMRPCMVHSVRKSAASLVWTVECLDRMEYASKLQIMTLAMFHTGVAIVILLGINKLDTHNRHSYNKMIIVADLTIRITQLVRR